MEFVVPAEVTEAARVQSRLWGTDPDGWASVAAPLNAPLFEALLAEGGVRPGSAVLDIGCGTGELLQGAAARGASVSGVDITPGLLEIAHARLPEADLRCADMEQLPFADASFDVVLGLNTFQFAADPLHALAEAARVCRPGGRLGIGMFAEPERCESTAIHLAMSAISPPSRQSAHTPYALSEPTLLRKAIEAAGLSPLDVGEVECFWRYDSADQAVRGLLSSAGATRAVEDSGRDAVVEVIRSAVAPFTDASSGVVSMRNVFRWTTANKPG